MNFSVDRNIETTCDKAAQEDGEAPVGPDCDAGSAVLVRPKAPNIADPLRTDNMFQAWLRHLSKIFLVRHRFKRRRCYVWLLNIPLCFCLKASIVLFIFVSCLFNFKRAFNRRFDLTKFEACFNRVLC